MRNQKILTYWRNCLADEELISAFRNPYNQKETEYFTPDLLERARVPKEQTEKLFRKAKEIRFFKIKDPDDKEIKIYYVDILIAPLILQGVRQHQKWNRYNNE